MNQTDPWPELLKAVLDELLKKRPGEPTTGSVFKQCLLRHAQKSNLSFPPSDEPDLKLSRFLERYRDVVAVSRRPGQDILIAPAGEPQLLVASALTSRQEHRHSHGPTKKAAGVRPDLFRAFTEVSSDQPWYDARLDQVSWIPAETNGPDGTLPIPRATLEEAIADRRSFAATCEPEIRALLEQALVSDRPLQRFSEVIRSKRLKFAWHTHRTRALVERITRWAQSVKIPWNEKWLVTPTQIGIEIDAVMDEHSHQALISFVARLDAADLARIVVPLDVVLKAIRGRS